MTSDGARHRRMLDAKDDAVILPAEQVAAMEDLLTTLYERRTALDTEIAQMHDRLHASGEARLRKQRRHGEPREESHGLLESGEQF